MSDRLLIRAEGLTKTYQLSRKSTAKLAALFGKRKAQTEFAPEQVHHALRGVDLKVNRGEKVAVIGRNGAGKSTLLKLITGVIQPTSGELEVRGKSHALLSLGAGFHPDFTGRQNAYAFLAHMGFAGKKADALVEDAIEFAEIEEYIDQPLKTYSTGMSARLMFAVSTALEPELLVIDEVLGVGDAYFQHKSFERIRELCTANDTTLLLVSHDVYSAMRLVDRAIWIDQGRIQADGEPAEVIKVYENSIRLQEDSRQKQKLAMAFRRDMNLRKAMMPAFIEIRARGNEPARSPVFFSHLTLHLPGGTDLPLQIMERENRPVRLNADYSAQLLPHTPWGDIEEIDGSVTRVWNNFGAVDHKVGLVIFPHNQEALDDLGRARFSTRVRANDVVDADIVYVDPLGAERILHRLLLEPNEWQEVSVGLSEGSAVEPAHPGAAEGSAKKQDTGRQGSGRIVLTGFYCFGPAGEETYTLEHGKLASFGFDYHINDPKLNENSQIIIVLRKNGVDDTVRIKGDEVHFDARQGRTGRFTARLDPLRLGTGRYTLTIMIAKERYRETQIGIFFAINPDVYDVHSGCMEFEVVDSESDFSQGAGVVAEAGWEHSTDDTDGRSPSLV